MTGEPAKPTEESDSLEGARQIGPYGILKVLGEGGMGTVYLAEQTEPLKRRVALKVIKLGMDTKQVLVRFDAERQALSMMEHDNIAKVLDAGATEAGRPYFAMEYVDGIPITMLADAERLSVEERIELFRQVCSGVQHAHEKGVLHRDLKPSNVLVTEMGDTRTVKIIDFGLARATDRHLVEATLCTEQGVVLGTPEYMSPEQSGFGSAEVDARTDVYSLGVLLYELLTGTLPFSAEELRSGGFVELQRKIREDDPPRPSLRITKTERESDHAANCRSTDPRTLGRRLRGDLDWIVMRALEKDPARRYASAQALSDDLARHLAHQPVLAGPPSAGYRLGKMLRRNRGLVTAGVAIVVALGLGIGATAWYFSDKNGGNGGNGGEVAQPSDDLTAKVNAALARAARLERIEGAATAADQELLRELHEFFHTLDKVHVSLSSTIAKDGRHLYSDLYDRVRTEYTRLVREFFLIPCERHIASALRTLLQVEKDESEFSYTRELFALYDMLTGRKLVDGNRLRELVGKHKLWAWDPADFGKKPAPASAKPHLDTFLALVIEGDGWQIAADGALVASVSKDLERGDPVLGAINQLMAPQRMTKVAIGSDVKSVVSGKELPKLLEADSAQLDEQLQATLKNFRIRSGPRARQFRRRFNQRVFDEWAGYFASLRPKSCDTLDGAAKAIRELTGEQSPYRDAYLAVHANLNERGLVQGKKPNLRWLDQALGHIRGLESEVQKFCAARPAGERLLGTVEAGEGEQLKSLMRAVGEVRRVVHRRVRSAEERLRPASRAALTNIIQSVDSALFCEAQAEATKLWKPIAAKLAEYRTKKPFAKNATESVPPEELEAMFAYPEGRVAKAIASLRKLASVRVPRGRFVQFTPRFARVAQAFAGLRKATSAGGVAAGSFQTNPLAGLQLDGPVFEPGRERQRTRRR